MADKVFLANRSELGHSFLNAMWVAGFLATIQIVAVAMAVIKRSPSPDQPVVSVVQGGLKIPDDIEVAPPVLVTKSPVEATPEAKVVSKSKVRQYPAADLSDITAAASRIKDSLLDRLVVSGVDDRKRGDLKGALEAFVEADQSLPGHPRILSELAGTIAEMGRLDEAAKYWNRVVDMGPIVAGPYHEIALKVLRGEDASIPDIEDGKFLKLGKLRLTKQPIAKDGEWVSLRIPIVGKAGVRLSGADMNIRVPFFDLINGKTIRQTTTAEISFDFPTEPYNWQENRIEEVEVIYHQPVLTVEQQRRSGDRSYFGYVIELYYRNELQDTEVSSDELRSLRFPPAKPVVEPLPPQGPDTSLFPINKI